MPNLKLVADAGPASRRTPRSARSKRVTPKSEQTRTLILEAAVDVLGSHGFHGANLSRIAETAGVTRGCLQYYFMTSQDIMITLAGYVARREWEAYEARAAKPPPGRDIIEYAIDMVAHPDDDRYRVARLELVTAARTTPALLPPLEEGARLHDERAKEFTAHIFGNPALADTPPFRAARALAGLVSDWLFVHIMPGDREQRSQEAVEALRMALHTLWRAPRLGVEPESVKPRVRVPAARPPTGEQLGEG